MIYKSLATAIALSAVFGVASAGTVLPPPRCTAIIDTPANSTQCTYRLPHVLEIKTPQGTATLNGSIDFKRNFDGAKHSVCDAYFVEMQKNHGKCKILHW